MSFVDLHFLPGDAFLRLWRDELSPGYYISSADISRLVVHLDVPIMKKNWLRDLANITDSTLTFKFQDKDSEQLYSLSSLEQLIISELGVKSFDEKYISKITSLHLLNEQSRGAKISDLHFGISLVAMEPSLPLRGLHRRSAKVTTQMII